MSHYLPDETTDVPIAELLEAASVDANGAPDALHEVIDELVVALILVDSNLMGDDPVKYDAITNLLEVAAALEEINTGKTIVTYDANEITIEHRKPTDAP